MQYFIHFYPAIVAMLSLLFYKRDGQRMQQFYRRMTFSESARKFFVLVLMLIMLSFNFCFLSVNGMTIPLAIGSVLCVSMFSFRLTERSLYWLHDRMAIGLAMLAALVCVALPHYWPLSFNLFVCMVASIFYPSRLIRTQLKQPDYFTGKVVQSQPIIDMYYSR